MMDLNRAARPMCKTFHILPTLVCLYQSNITLNRAACISLIAHRKDRLKGHLVVTPECLGEELHWHEQLHSQLKQKSSDYDSLHHLKILSQTTEIEEEKAEEEGGPEKGKQRIHSISKPQTRIEKNIVNLTGINLAIKKEHKKCIK